MPTVSWCHAELNVSEHRVTVRDVGSRNGTFIDGNQIQYQPLRTGQLIRFAEARLVLASEAEEQQFDCGSEISTADPRCSVEQLLELPPTFKAKFSQRQQEVLELAWNARSQKQIAADLGISVFTVGQHLQAIYAICEVHSIGEFQQHLFHQVIQALIAQYPELLSQRPAGDGQPPHGGQQERRA